MSSMFYYLCPMREDRQLHNILDIISNYSTKEPLNRYLKNHFNVHREMGSRDRRQVADFIYNFYRIGRAIPERTQEERITVGNYLCADSPSPVLQYCISKFLKGIDADWQISQGEKINKIKILYPDFKLDDVFHQSTHISEQINKESFILSLLKQPKLWIRVRRKFLKEVTDELTKENISFEASEENPLTISFVNSSKLNKLKSYENGYFEIQDWSSQQTINYFKPNPNEHWWDACAGSGGKSLMLYDAEPLLHLTVSDSRESILKNLEERFRKAGIRTDQSFQTDLTNLKPQTLNLKEFDGIIADVPCTGSGTWARTPEWLSVFEEKSISSYSDLQKKIVSNIIPFLKMNCPLIYITCSAFKEENEEVVMWIKNKSQLNIVESAYIKGYDKGGDTMFVARMMK